MSYMLYPAADLSGRETNYETWVGGFSDNEISRVTDYCDKEIQVNGMKGSIGAKDEFVLNEEIRKSTILWVAQNQDTGWLYDKVAFIINQLNAQFFQFDLYGLDSNIQYTVYKGSVEDGDHYNWHMDKGFNVNQAPRKLSMVVQLSDPTEYEGGDLLLKTGTSETITERTKGLVHVFPAWVLHRVTPVTKGTRKTLVLWFCGKKFV